MNDVATQCTTFVSISKTSFMKFIRVVFIAVCLLPLSCLFAQALTIPDILKIHSLDSAAARQYCTDKKLPLINADNTGSNMRYQYATPDSSYRLEVVYPNDSASANVQMSYWFTGAGNYKTIEAGLRKAGFHRQSARQSGGTLPPNAARYIANALQAELIRPQGIQKSYWLFLHPVGKYTW